MKHILTCSLEIESTKDTFGISNGNGNANTAAGKVKVSSSSTAHPDRELQLRSNLESVLTSDTINGDIIHEKENYIFDRSTAQDSESNAGQADRKRRSVRKGSVFILKKDNASTDVCTKDESQFYNGNHADSQAFLKEALGKSTNVGTQSLFEDMVGCKK